MKNKKVITVNWFCGCCGKDIEQTKESVLILEDNDIDNIYQIGKLPCPDCVVKHFDFGTEENNIKIVSQKKKIENSEEEEGDEELEETNEETEEQDKDEYEEEEGDEEYEYEDSELEEPDELDYYDIEEKEIDWDINK